MGLRSTVKLCQTKLGPPLSTPISDPEAVCALLRPIGRADRESFYALHLDARNQVNAIDEVARGSLTGVETHPREIFKAAILNQAKSVIVAHNHPSTSSEPSGADIDMTRKLVEAGRLLGIPVLDHIVVGGDTCHSMAQKGDVRFSGSLLGDAPPAPVKKRRAKIPG